MQNHITQIETDVLVLGGGMAAAWAAISAAKAGVRVIVADKGVMGTSGVTATAGPNHWFLPEDAREAAVQARLKSSLGLGDGKWMRRILKQTWETLPSLSHYYEFCVNDEGATVFNSVRGPEYMRALRRYVDMMGVKVLGHAPALELLLHDDGSIAGASGEFLRTGESWEIRANAVVLATGGCGFLSHLLGSRTNTGDGYLMAAETGVALSGMEFSSQYTIAPAFSTMTRAMSYVFATYYTEDGRQILPGPDATNFRYLAEALRNGPVYCDLSLMPQDIRDRLPYISPNVMPVFRRQNINPFEDRFPVSLVAEGTIRGVGGLQIENDNCETSTPGLFAAGDAASREFVTGAISGGGAVNAAWALSSGIWSGAAAAQRRHNTGKPRPAGQAGLRPQAEAKSLDAQLLAKTASKIATDFSVSYFRSEATLKDAREKLDAQWHEISRHLTGGWRAREAAALTATARWCVNAALHRRETRGIHLREDFTDSLPHLAKRQILRGIENIKSNFDKMSEQAA